MASEHEKRSPVAIGFAGLSSLVSDVDGLIAKVTQRAAARSPRAATLGTALPSGPGQRSDRRRRQPATGFPARWVWGAAGAVFVLWLIATVSNQGGSGVSPARRPVSTSPSQAPDTSGVPTSAAPQRHPSEIPSASSTEQMPTIGTDRLLNAAQIRYCLSEDIRLEAARDIVSAEPQLDRFNSMVRDFNSRCGRYRYALRVFESVQREVQANMASLQVEGIARFQR